MALHRVPGEITNARDAAHSGGTVARATILQMKFVFNIVLILLPSFAYCQTDDSFLPRVHTDRFWLSGQANVVFQTQPGTRGECDDEDTFSTQYEKATSRVFTLYTGMKLSPSTELLLDVEQAGGETLSRGFGLAAPTNADYIGPVYGAKPYVSRFMLRKVVALSSTNEEVDRGPMSTFSMLPARRFEFRLGKFGTNDFFDTNAAGSDTHLQFLNSAMMQNAAYDFASDAAGYSWGAMAEYTSGAFSLRFAEMLMPGAPGGTHLLWNLRNGHSENVELQLAPKLLPHRSTVVRLLAFRNHGPMISYADPITIASKYGAGINVEQTLHHGLTAFARLGWNNGVSQSFCYDEVDNTASAGIVAHGSLWHRAFDRAGVGIATNGLTRAHALYLSRGDSGLLLGDGDRDYARERGIELFYTVHVKRGVYLSPSLQWIANPGMNRDRGNAMIAGWRTHVEF
jgi:high affinity Mn2+ porin